MTKERWMIFVLDLASPSLMCVNFLFCKKEKEFSSHLF